MPVPYYDADAYSHHIPTLLDRLWDCEYSWTTIKEAEQAAQFSAEPTPEELALDEARAEMAAEAWAECDGYYRDLERSLYQYDWLAPLNQTKRAHLQKKISGFTYFAHAPEDFSQETEFYKPEYLDALADFVPDARQTNASAGYFVMEYLFEWAQPFGINLDKLVRRLYGTFEFDTVLKDLGIGMELMLPVRHVPQLVRAYLTVCPLAALTDTGAAAHFRDADDWQAAFTEYLRLGFAGNVHFHEQIRQKNQHYPYYFEDDGRAWQTGYYPMLQSEDACFWHGLDVDADFEMHRVINYCHFRGPFPRDFIAGLPETGQTDIDRLMAACELAEQVLNRYFVSLMRAAYNDMAQKRRDLLLRQEARYQDLLRIYRSQYERRKPPAGWQEAEPLI